MTQLSRRGFLKSAAAVSLGFAGLRSLTEIAGAAVEDAAAGVGYGPLLPDPYGILNLPAGFRYRIISKHGEPMDDGLFVPAKMDGMGAFAGPDGLTLLIRNHETINNPRDGAFGWTNERFDQIDPGHVYDTGFGTRPATGGTTTLVYDTRTQTLKSQYLSLAGTVRNCAGGVTPWGSWVTCEEYPVLANDVHEQDHGYNFEVPASPRISLAKPVPLKAMGRFNHEAIAVDPTTGIVYQTEDRGDGLIYRYLPNEPGKLEAGGRLQALALLDRKRADTRNWPPRPAADGEASPAPAPPPRIEPGVSLATYWIDIRDVESPSDNLRHQGFSAGAACFARGEGMWYGHDSIFFACTNGGTHRRGQIWRYTPSPQEGTADEARAPGQLELFIEADETNLIQNADNLTVAPWGDVVVCEDCGKDSTIVGVTPQGQTYLLADNVLDGSEFAGGVFSPDGTTFFVNMQSTGVTLAITGPWRG